MVCRCVLTTAAQIRSVARSGLRTLRRLRFRRRSGRGCSWCRRARARGRSRLLRSRRCSCRCGSRALGDRPVAKEDDDQGDDKRNDCPYAARVHGWNSFPSPRAIINHRDVYYKLIR
ncbi:(2Fe-2S)-binding protein [Rhizobium sp. ARZ01]|nr:(2Fe-2S)-binding protein [Rhizobium sp. ARZ01]